MVCRGFRECHTTKIKLKGCKMCMVKTCESKPTVSEHKVSYTVNNRNNLTVLKFLVDGGLITGVDQERCDYLLMVPECLKAFFVELKGQGWEKAVSQLENTVKLIYPEMNMYTPHLRAVVKRKAPATNYIPLMKRRIAIMKRYADATLEVNTRFSDEV